MGINATLTKNLDFRGVNLSLLIEKELFLSILPLIHRIILIDRIN